MIDRKIASTRDVVEWPEYKAFMDRIGINRDLRTTRIVIDIKINSTTVRQSFFPIIKENEKAI